MEACARHCVANRSYASVEGSVFGADTENVPAWTGTNVGVAVGAELIERGAMYAFNDALLAHQRHDNS